MYNASMQKITNITYLFALIIGMSACGQSEETPAAASDMPIRWEVTSVEGMQNTRTLIGRDNDELSLEAACTNEAIAVWGTFDFKNTNTDENASVFLNTPLTYGSNVWSYPGEQYWMPNATYEFRACYPKNALGSHVTATDASSLTITYDTETLQEDLLVAYKEVDADVNEGKAVPLAMNHALAAIRFQFQVLGDVTMKLQSFTLSNDTEGSGLSTSGTLTYATENVELGHWETNDPIAGEFYKWEYPVSGSDDGALFSQTKATAYQPNENTLYTDNKGYVLIIPQTYDGKTNLKMVIDGEEHVVALPATSFLPGNRYTYLIQVKGGEPIILKCVVDPWELMETTNEFTNTVVVEDAGKITWTSGTYTSNAEDASQIILKDDINSPAEFTFKISRPRGGTWHAIIRTITGDTDAFELLDTEGNVKTEGAVGETVTLRLKAKRANTTNISNTAELTFVVRNGGLVLPVDIITTLPGGQNYTIVQNFNK